MSFNDYVSAVRKDFKDISKLPDAEIDKYFKKASTDKVLREYYGYYQSKNKYVHNSASTAAVASCLDMMY